MGTVSDVAAGAMSNRSSHLQHTCAERFRIGAACCKLQRGDPACALSKKIRPLARIFQKNLLVEFRSDHEPNLDAIQSENP